MECVDDPDCLRSHGARRSDRPGIEGGKEAFQAIRESIRTSPVNAEPGEFVYEYLGIHSVFDEWRCVQGCFRISGHVEFPRRLNDLEAAYTSPMVACEGFPGLRVGRYPFAADPLRGILHCEGMVRPYGLDINAELHPARLDTLYFYLSNGLLGLGRPSWTDHAATGPRFDAPDQGRLMMFGFPLFHFPDDELEPILTAGLRWLLEE